ncbi:uncharacterized protein EDB91DRAFT_620819 [Suillus paluster]|uniref:uncharacterized protein n=1 Tax=Suillus paluster TaxID=48578 RepID=UPI001B8726A3|nr:uncharacterized protein EDB91DRAFT_620819 [Suillus paluster]KAG1734084.1 hypothetical protein EDB91DRAFT_620819 [Suillus paluster]
MPMAIPSIEGLQQATTELLKEAHAEGNLSKLTVRVIRERLEQSLQLSPGTLDVKEYKAPIKKTVVDYLDNVPTPPNGADEGESQPKPSKKRKVKADEEPVKTRKSTSKPKAPPGKGAKGKQVPKSSAIVESEVSESSEDDVPARKKPAKKKAASKLRSEDENDEKHEAKPSTSKRSQKASKTKNSTSRIALKTHKSASIVESSGDEAGSTRPSEPVVTSPKKDMQSHEKLPSKEKPLSKPKSTTKQSATREVDDEAEHGASSSTSRPPEPVTMKPARPKSKVHARDEPGSDSELSTVIDEPPKKRKKKQDKDSGKTGPKEHKKGMKSNAGGSSKHDEAVSKLKAMVVACGVRKQWKKEFANLDTPSAQIKRLKEILSDLGMVGRPTLEKAKAIKAERELAQELRDVQEFAEAQEKRKGKGVSEDEQSGPESDDEDEGPPVKRKKTAGASILAFLGDQSDDE